MNKTFTECKWKSIKYVPALLKIIYEILDNCIDEFDRSNGKYATKIDVCVDDKHEMISIKDNGRGIPLKMTKDANGKDISMFELALTSLRAGSNFNDQEGRTSLGQNGVGSSCTVIFSKYFHAISKDGSQIGELVCENNMDTKTCKIKSKVVGKNEQGTFVEFIPDYKRFKLKNLSEAHIDLLYQRIMFLSYMYPEITFTYNKKTVKFKNAKNLMSIFSDKAVVVQDTKSDICHYMIGVIPNENDDFTQKSYINGADCINGGNHLDYIHSELIGRIKDKLSRKYPNIRPGDIKNRISYVVCFREFVNPMFNSQTKENFSSDINEIKEFLKDIDWDEFSNKVCKCSEIIDPIVESFKIKEELKNRQTLNKLGNGRKKVRCEKYLPAIKSNKYLAICEGDSALGGLINGLGRKEIGYFATRGVPLNTYEVSVQKIVDNEELSNLIKILGLRLGDKEQDMNYDKVLLSEDSDADGYHIASLYIGFFQKYAPSIVKAGKLCKLNTPLICLKDKSGNIHEMFFTFEEYNSYMEKHSTNKYEIKYYKGLGSWKAVELQGLIQQYGLDYFIETLEPDNETAQLVDEWLSTKQAEARREYLRNNKTFSIAKI